MGIAICKKKYPFYYELNRLSNSIILNVSNLTLLYRWQLKRKGKNIKEEWTIPWVQYSKRPLKRECQLTIAAQSLVGRSVRTARAISWKCLDIYPSLVFVWELQTKNSTKFKNSFAYFFHINLECFEKSQYMHDRDKTPSGIINGLVLYYTMLYYVINKLVNILILNTSNLVKQRD